MSGAAQGVDLHDAFAGRDQHPGAVDGESRDLTPPRASAKGVSHLETAWPAA